MTVFRKLDPRVQKWVYKQGWSDLRELQKKCIEPVLAGDRDVLISAGTAAGKTEAFFLPACSAITNIQRGFGILYISPLKALINDQYRRLESLGDVLDIPVTPWHGDIARSKKQKIRKDPSGILLITPESLEALLVRNTSWVKQSFSSLAYIVIDEFHAFIGSERGMQLLSLLNRLEHLVGKIYSPIPRVALSATLGELERVPLMLRPDKRLSCDIIADNQNQTKVNVQVKGYLELSPTTLSPATSSSEMKICRDIFRLCRGDSHLVFANSRSRTESIAATLDDLSEIKGVPNEFFPHHGSLSKEHRESLEARLQKGRLPTTAICTMTLELGIDIGRVSSVVQVTAPHSVASLRQRMGRSGRRGSPAVLRILVPEQEITSTSGIIDQLRLQLVQSLAMIRLLIVNKWFEPADTQRTHYSTLFHQILAIVAQWGGVRADQLWLQLCRQGPFQNTGIEEFKTLLKHMGKLQFLTQLSSNELVLGIEGEYLVNHYTFFSVFMTPEEFRLVSENKTLGSIPVDSPLIPEQHIIFGGKRWKIICIDSSKKIIFVDVAKGGKPPIFGGSGMSIHDVVRQEMREIYRTGDYRIAVGERMIDFADDNARDLFSQGVSGFRGNRLDSEAFLQFGESVYIFPWLGDKIVNTLSAILIMHGFKSGTFSGVIEVEMTTVSEIITIFKYLIENGFPSEALLADVVAEKCIEKYDCYLPEELLTKEYGMRAFDVSQTIAWLLRTVR